MNDVETIIQTLIRQMKVEVTERDDMPVGAYYVDHAGGTISVECGPDLAPMFRALQNAPCPSPAASPPHGWDVT